jgi:hypothetical protein
MKLLFLVLFLSLSTLSFAQESDTIQIKRVINTMFDGMRQGDSAMVSSVFHKNISFSTTYSDKNGNAHVKSADAGPFLKAIGTPHDKIWDEQISNLNIQIDQNLAHAWMDYKFYLGGTLNHCGVNSMELVKTNGVWKIIYLIDTQKKKFCD